MRFFRLRKRTPDADQNHVVGQEDVLMDPETGLYASWYLRRRLAEEVRRALRYKRPFSIIACFPQRLPGEASVQAMKSAGPHFGRLLRGGDLVGRTGDQIIAIGLLETPPRGARVLAQRLRSELGLRSASWNKEIWQVGWASCPENGESPEALLESAIAAAKDSRHSAA